jgi:hypothetical protein
MAGKWCGKNWLKKGEGGDCEEGRRGTREEKLERP